MNSRASINELIADGIRFLNSSSPTPALDIEILLCEILGKTKEFLYTNPEKTLRTKDFNKYWKYLKKRKQGYPIAYLTGKKEFYGLDFCIDQSTLVPRPETEIIIDEVIKLASRSYGRKKLNIADIGTGSGCIAITLAKSLKDKINTIYATDTSRKTLLTAVKNAKTHQVSEKIKFIQGSLLSPVVDKKVDILIANLPYLPHNKKREYYNSSPGLAYEPASALFTKDNGFYQYKILLKQLSRLQYKPNQLFLEIEPTQTKRFSSFKNKIIIKDLRGHNRLIIINLRD